MSEQQRTEAAGDRPVQLRTKDGAPYDVPVEGSLGLLALGYVGLMAWREARVKKAPTKPTQQQPG